MSPRHFASVILVIAALLYQPGIAGPPSQSSSIAFEGSLQAAEVDNFDQAAGVWINKRILLLNTAGGELLELDGLPAGLARAEIGRRIRVYGFLREQKLVVEHFEPVQYPESAFAPMPPPQPQQAEQKVETLGAQKALVALFNFSDVPNKPFTVDSVRARILSDAKSTDKFLRENSYGKLWLDVDFVDWKTLQAKSNELCPGST